MAVLSPGSRQFVTSIHFIDMGQLRDLNPTSPIDQGASILPALLLLVLRETGRRSIPSLTPPPLQNSLLSLSLS